MGLLSYIIFGLFIGGVLFVMTMQKPPKRDNKTVMNEEITKTTHNPNHSTDFPHF